MLLKNQALCDNTEPYCIPSSLPSGVQPQWLSKYLAAWESSSHNHQQYWPWKVLSISDSSQWQMAPRVYLISTSEDMELYKELTLLSLRSC